MYTKKEIKELVKKTTPIERWEEFSAMFDWAEGNLIRLSPNDFEYAAKRHSGIQEECAPFSSEDTFRFGRDDTFLGKRVAFCL